MLGWLDKLINRTRYRSSVGYHVSDANLRWYRYSYIDKSMRMPRWLEYMIKDHLDRCDSDCVIRYNGMYFGWPQIKHAQIMAGWTNNQLYE